MQSELEPSPAIIISPMSAFKGTRSSVGTGAGRAGDKVKRSSRERECFVAVEREREREMLYSL